jgi:hypothetical protein
MAQRVWARQRRPSARRVARALAGYPVHFVTVARWRARNWEAQASEHPLEIARGRLEAVAPLASGDPETTLEDLVDDPAVEQDLDSLTDGEVLRRAAREVAIATALVAKAIQGRTAAAFNITEVTPALLSIAACLAALPSALDQAISLDAADLRSDRLRMKA